MTKNNIFIRVEPRMISKIPTINNSPKQSKNMKFSENPNLSLTFFSSTGNNSEILFAGTKRHIKRYLTVKISCQYIKRRKL